MGIPCLPYGERAVGVPGAAACGRIEASVGSQTSGQLVDRFPAELVDAAVECTQRQAKGARGSLSVAARGFYGGEESRKREGGGRRGGREGRGILVLEQHPCPSVCDATEVPQGIAAHDPVVRLVL